MRAGWTSNSQVPTQNYAIPLNIQGGLSYARLLHSTDLLSGQLMSSDDEEHGGEYLEK